MANKPAKKNPQPVQKPFILGDTKKYGTVAQQTELNEFMRNLTVEQVQVVQAVITRFSTGACINGDGTIDPDTGLRTTGGYRKSVHWLKAYLANRPMPVQLG